MPVSSLLAKITREYEKKGYSKAEAQKIAKATVYGKIERLKKTVRKKRVVGRRTMKHAKRRNKKSRTKK